MCVLLCIYQQLRSAAAEPAVSWCQVNAQKTPPHTPRLKFISQQPRCARPVPLTSPHSSPVSSSPLLPISLDPICVLTVLALSFNPNIHVEL
ncbi:hypothetical protein NQZ68_020938 [Dissostichus eleginoides]|nr:hypothetical protein NQZ68_020938 [Dissostichus eleginoides]